MDAKDPAVARLLDAPDVAELIQRRQLHAAYARLKAKRRDMIGSPDLAALEWLLGQRRLFLEPIDGAPTMFTFNGVGTALYGTSELRPDGTHIATLCVCVVFIPVFPLAQYLVCHAGGSSWRFFGKVPTSAVARAWRAGSVAAVAMAAACVALVGWWSQQHSQVTFVNGLDVPVEVTFQGERFDVVPGDHQARSAAKGRHHVALAGRGGERIREADIDVPGGVDVVAFNVLGAAPLYAEEVLYGERPSPGAEPQTEYAFFAGQEVVVREHVDYAFTKPPETIKLSNGASVTSRWHFDVAEGGWRTTLRILSDRRDPEALRRFAYAIADAEPEQEEAIGAAVASALGPSKDVEEALGWARAFTEAHPASIEGHRAYQSLLLREGREAECRDAYRRMHEQQPGSAMAAYLRVRVERFAEARRLYPELVARFPDDEYLRRGHAWLLYRAGEHAAALAALDGIRTPRHVARAMEVRWRALLGLGRAGEAVTALASHLDGTPAAVDVHEATAYARLVVAAPDGAPHPFDHYVGRLFDEKAAPVARIYVAAVAGHPVSEADVAAIPDGGPRVPIAIMVAARTDPDKALAVARDAETLAGVADTALFLLATEAVRRGEGDLGARLLDALSEAVVERAAVRALVLRGERDPDIGPLDPEQEAALLFAAARRADAEGKRDAVAYERAASADPFHGAVVQAVRGWPAPARAGVARPAAK